MTSTSTLETSSDAALKTVRRLKIVHLISSLKGGGMEHFVVRLAEAQRRTGHDAVVLALQDGVLEQACKEKGVPVKVLGGRNKIYRVIRGAAYFAGFRPDVAHAHNPTSLHYAVLGKKMCGARVVMTDHAQTRGVTRPPTAREVQQTDAIAGVSAATLREPSVEGGPAIRVVVHNGIEPPPTPRNRRQMRAELGLNDEPTAIMIAGMDPVKGHVVLLDAIAQLRDRGSRLVTLIVGDGAERENIERRAAELGLTAETVRFLGYRSDVGDLLNASDFLVLPSMNEGLPICILEGMAHGIPIVATAVGGTPELVLDRENGILIPPRDTDALVAAIDTLVGSPDLTHQYGEAARHHVQTHFTFDGSVLKYDDLYSRLNL